MSDINIHATNMRIREDLFMDGSRKFVIEQRINETSTWTPWMDHITFHSKDKAMDVINSFRKVETIYHTIQ